jgi:TolB protein
MLVLVVAAACVAGASAAGSVKAPALLTYAVLDARGGLCLAAADGSRRERLTTGADRTPSWSPDGRFVAFARTDGNTTRIVVADARGRVVRRFGTGSANADPAWSPDGKRIAYTAAAGSASRIVVANVAGRTLAQLPATGVLASSPAWSPDGRRLAYAEQLDSDAEREGQPSAVFVIGADGAGRRALARNAGEPSWSPDGSRIAYVAHRSRWSETGDVVVAGADGGAPRRLTATREPESRPAWSPDGRLIAFARGDEAAGAIVVVRAEGGGERVVVRSRAHGVREPAWRPPVALPRSRRAACS